jgi:hypothetical protein
VGAELGAPVDVDAPADDVAEDVAGVLLAAVFLAGVFLAAVVFAVVFLAGVVCSAVSLIGTPRVGGAPDPAPRADTCHSCTVPA